MRYQYLILASMVFFMIITKSATAQEKAPNIIIIITDDQGYGDLGVTGNPHVKTPVIDEFAKSGIRLNNFYVSPVCAPTRASLLTGRYSLRTGVHDTYNGGAIMATEEITLAELIKEKQYSTGVFGKWHLGDSYPSRPVDQGFDESLIHLSGGMGQVGDFTTFFEGDSSYFNPVLWHNGEQEAYKGYCSDIFTDAAINFIENNSKNRFFCYLSFNAPHTPLQVPDNYYQMYKDIDPSEGFAEDNRPFSKMSEKDKEDARKVYAMVTNIDDNLGRLFQKLDELNIRKNTLIIFLTDNGPQQTRYIAGMRGLKGDVYNGGVRVPCFIQYPEAFKENKEIKTMTAHVDILPTIADICNIALPHNRIIDGESFLPLIMGKEVLWADRSFFSYWTRRFPVLYDNIAIQNDRFKLVGHSDYNSEINEFELFNIKEDPYELHNVINENKSIAASLKKELDQYYDALVHSENLVNAPPIIIGSKHENPIYLNRNDAGGQRGVWTQEEIYGKWRIHIKEGYYDIRIRFFEPVEPNGNMFIELNTILKQYTNKKKTDAIELKNVYFREATGDLIPYYQSDGKRILPFLIEMERK